MNIRFLRKYKWDGLTLVVSLIFGFYYFASPIYLYNHALIEVFDYGITFQSTYLLAFFKDLIITLRGNHVFADNQEYLQTVLSLFQHLPFPHYFLISAHSAGIFSVGLFCLYYLQSESKLTALAVAVSVWFSPLLFNGAMDLFHTEAFSTILILLVFLSAKKNKVKLFYVTLILALLCKEDVAVTTGLMMVLFYFEHQRFQLKKNHYVIAFFLSIFVFSINLFLILPYFKEQTCLWLNPLSHSDLINSNPSSPFYENILSNWYRPLFLVQSFSRLEVLRYIFFLMWPALIFVRYVGLLIFLPFAGMFINIISNSSYLVSGFYHYDFCTIAGVVIIILEGVSRIKWKSSACSFLLIFSVIAHAFLFPIRTTLFSVLQGDYDKETKIELVDFLERFNNVVPQNTVISADDVLANYLIVGHPNIYMFPNPNFGNSYFGLYRECVAFNIEPISDLVLIREHLGFEKEIGNYSKISYKEFEISGLNIKIYLSPRFMNSGQAKEILKFISAHNEKFKTD